MTQPKKFVHRTTGETALVQLSEDESCLMVQFDRFNHMQSHGWWAYPYEAFFPIEKGEKLSHKNFNWDNVIHHLAIYWPENSELPYTREDFIALAGDKARELFDLCEWEAPETIIDQGLLSESE